MNLTDEVRAVPGVGERSHRVSNEPQTIRLVNARNGFESELRSRLGPAKSTVFAVQSDNDG